jgi:uncharacterized protein (TIGR00251 family)
MKITIRVKTNARKDEVKQIDEKHFQVSVNASPVDGKANEKLIELLAEHFGRSKRSITILHGLASRNKVIEIT